MAYILGCVVPVVLAVFYVWMLGGMLGAVAWAVTMGLGLTALRHLSRYVDAEQSTHHGATPVASSSTTSQRPRQ